MLSYHLHAQLKAKSGQNAETWKGEINAAVKANTHQRTSRMHRSLTTTDEQRGSRSESVSNSGRKSSIGSLFSKRSSNKPAVAESVDRVSVHVFLIV